MRECVRPRLQASLATCASDSEWGVCKLPLWTVVTMLGGISLTEPTVPGHVLGQCAVLGEALGTGGWGDYLTTRPLGRSTTEALNYSTA